MKRYLIVTTVILAVVFLFITIAPTLLSGKVEKNIASSIEKNVTEAVVEWEKLSLSLFKRFPNLSIDMQNIVVCSKTGSDTLLTAENLLLCVKPLQALFGKHIAITGCEALRPVFTLQTDADSVSNLANLLPSEKRDTLQAGKAFNMPVRRLNIVDGTFRYVNKTQNSLIETEGLYLHIKNSRKSDASLLEIVSSAETFSFTKNGVPCIKNATVDFTGEINASLHNSSFTFGKNELNFNKLPLQFSGTVEKTDDGLNLNIQLTGSDSDFKSILAFLPQSLQKNGMPETSGTFVFDAKAQGIFVNANRLPAFGLKITATDGMIKYPEKSKSIDSINIDMDISSKGGPADSTVVNLRNFCFDIGGNSFNANLNIVTPVSNAGFKGNLNGVIDFSMLKEALPLDSLELKGIISSTLAVEGNFAMINSEEYEKLKSTGTVELVNFEMINSSFPAGIEISEARLNFFPRYMELASFKSKIGGSDFSFKGKLENYLSYLLKNGVLKGKLEHTSSFLDGNELMRIHASKENRETDSVTTTKPSEKILIPNNLDIEMSSYFDRIVFNKLELRKTKGVIKTGNSTLKLGNLNTELLNGKMVMNGEYSTLSPAQPAISLNIALTAIDINKAAHSFAIVESMLPISQNAKGAVSGSLKLNGTVDHGLTTVQSSLNGGGNLKSNSIEIAGSNVQKALSAMLKDTRYEKASIGNLNIDFDINNGNISIKPFDVDFAGKKVNVAGKQMLDKTIDYSMKIPVTRDEINQFAALIGNTIPSGNSLVVEVLITGTSDSPELKLNIEDIKSQLEKEYKDDVEKATKAVEKLLEDPKIKNRVEEMGRQLKKLFE